MLYSMKAVCEKTGMTYEALKFYCNQGLVPNVKRDSGNRRVFDERDVAWIESLSCLKRCGLSIQEMRHYVQLCLQGKDSIPERKVILAQKRQVLLEQIALLQGAVDCVFEENGGLILVDYKTDYVKEEQELKNRYCRQLSLYALALEQTTGLKVTEQYLYSFSLGEAVRIN